MGSALAPGGGLDGVRASGGNYRVPRPQQSCAGSLRLQGRKLLLQELPGARHVTLRGANVTHRQP